MITFKFSVLVKDMQIVSNILAIKNSQENIEHEKRWKGETYRHLMLRLQKFVQDIKFFEKRLTAVEWK